MKIAPPTEAAVGLARDLIADECAVGDRERRAVPNVDGAPTVADCRVVGHRDVSKGQRTADVQDSGSCRTGCPAVSDRQSGDGDDMPCTDVEYTADIVAADGQQARTRSLNVKALVDVKVATGQRNGMAPEGRIENYRIAIVGVNDRIAKRSRSFVEMVQDRQGARHRPVFEALHGEPQTTLPPGSPRFIQPVIPQ
jgi:hypothetical protein